MDRIRNSHGHNTYNICIDQARACCDEYRWHGLGERNDLIADHPLYLALGRNEDARRAAYRTFFRAHLEEAALDDIRQAVQQGLPLGNDRFREQVEAALGRKAAQRRRGRPEGAPANAPLPGQMGLGL